MSADVRIFLLLLSALCLSGAPAASVAAPLTQQKIAQLDFRDITVGDALKVLTEQSNLNIIASQEAAQIHITMYLQDITPLEVIDAISRTYNLWYKQDRNSNVIRIYTVKEYRMEQVEFKQEHTEIFTLKNANNALDLADTIQNLYGYDRVQLSFGENQFELMSDLSTRFALFDMVDGRTSEFGNSNNGNGNGNGSNRSGGSGSRGSTGRGSFGGGGGYGSGGFGAGFNGRGGFGSSGFGNNRGRNTRGQNLEDDSLDPVNSTIAELRKKNADLQNILAGESGQSDAMLNRALVHQAPIYVSVIKRQNRVLVRTRDQEAMNDIRDLYHKLDAESSMLLMEVKILSIDLSDGYDSLFDFKIKSDKTNITGGINATQALSQSLESVAAAFNPALLATVVSDKFEARLQLLEKENRITQLATPVLMTTNQEVSRVFIGDERPIVNGYEASVATTANASALGNIIVNSFVVPQTELRNIGTTLLLTPNINADRTVSIRVLIEQSVLSGAKAEIPVAVGNQLVDAKVDVVQSKTFSGTVVAKDGTAIAVGGLIEEQAGDGENKVPVLGDIPGLGFFFRDQSKQRGRKELVVIIRPYITSTPTEAAQVSKQFLSNNSQHPSAPDAGNLDVYTNQDRRHKGYQLEQPFKEYPLQDKFDQHHDKGDRSRYKIKRSTRSEAPQKKQAPTEAQKIYVELTQYAANAVRLPAHEREQVPFIEPTPLAGYRSFDLLYDTRIRAVPVAGWKRGGIHVTAVELHNTAKSEVDVNYRDLKGRWLASTMEGSKLAPQGEFGDSTYMYLISAEAFDDIARRLADAGEH
ncbi:MAG: DUF3438 family protein [Gammaproteobacteria bacterium]